MSESEKQAEFKPRRGPQIFAAAAVSIGGFAMGSVIAWTSPALPSLEEDETFEDLTDIQESWIASLVPLASLIAGPPVGLSMDQFGRKATMLCLTVPLLLGWLLISFAKNIPMIYGGRILTGFCAGSYSLVAPIFISETTEADIRGTLGSLCQLMVTLGIFLSYLVGTFVSWHWLALITSFVPIILAILVIFVPESPRFLLSKGKSKQAREALRWLRGATSTEQIEDEITTMQDSIDESNKNNTSFKDIFQTVAILKPTGICLGLMFFQQASGIDAVVFYTVDIFREAGTNLDSNLSTIIVGGVQVISFFLSGVLIDRAGRRPLLLISASFMAISIFALGLFFKLSKDDPTVKESLGWLPLSSLVLFCIAFSIGFGPLPWIIMSELLPNHVIGTVSGMTICFNWTLVFLVTRFFASLKEAMGLEWCYWMFSIFCAIGTIFTYFCVPETKCKSLEEIQKQFATKES